MIIVCYQVFQIIYMQKNQLQKDERFVGYDVVEYEKSWEWTVHSSLQPSFKEHLLGLGIILKKS